MIIETPVQSLSEAIAAESLGATQLELCADLANDGLTPSYDLIKEVLDHVSIPVKVMIRPHSRNFIYSPNEIDQMKADINFAKEIGAMGVVFGALDENDQMNLKIITELAAAANPLQVTIHKAIDFTPSPVIAAQELSSIPGIHYILTSGGKTTALEGASNIIQMMQVASPIKILAAGKITTKNLQELHSKLNTFAYHGRLIVGPIAN